jgi:electron transfer flavoprotein alpha subunit
MAGADVIIICEAGDGQTESANARLIAVGVTLAEHWGGKLVCALAGHSIEANAAALSLHVDEIYVADSPLHAHYNAYVHLKVVQKLVEDLQPRAVLFGHTYVGMDLAPRLASKLKVGMASNCIDVQIEKDAVYLTRPMYRGRVHAKVAMDFSPMLATLQIGGAELPPGKRTGTVKRIDVPPEQGARVRPIRTIEPSREGIDIAKADIIVAGGRGIGERENFALVSDLAEALGGVPACSRPLVDMGWFGANYQVGLSGNTVKPKLYIACGISGAVEHVQGMKESECIVAVNKDPDAPIFKIAHYGLVGNIDEIVPKLIKEVRAVKAGEPYSK